ncbi:MAG: ECF transporter S component, partial [Spirochaetota bacterium]
GNTVLVLGTLTLMFPRTVPFSLALKVGLANGVMEAVIAAVLTVAVVSAWRGLESRGGKSRLAGEGD